MDWSGLPPLAALKAFEAAARNTGYTAAGRELNVSHAAIAQQVRVLEAFLDVKLVERAGRGLALTSAGVRLSDGLSRGFSVVSQSVREMVSKEANRPLLVTMTPGFAVSWFMPRFHLFTQLHPDIELRINPTAKNIDLIAERYDVAIRFGTGNWDGLVSEPLVASDFIIVGTPALAAGRKIEQPEDLLGLPWLQEIETEEIAHWLAALDVRAPPKASVIEIPGYMMLPALRQGQGIGVTARVFVEDDIAEGRLLTLFDFGDRAPTNYHLVQRPGVQRPALKLFVKWLRNIARAE